MIESSPQVLYHPLLRQGIRYWGRAALDWEVVLFLALGLKGYLTSLITVVHL